MQMTSATNDYSRYVLNNLIDSLDLPYRESLGETSGLSRLSAALAESPRGVAIDRLDAIRNEGLDPGCLAKLIDALADQIVMDDRFHSIDFDLIRALLYLQCNDPRIKGRVLKYLRCEDLSDADRRLLGGIVPRSYDIAPTWLLQGLGKLMAALESAPLVLCVDQLEDIYNLDDAAGRFRRAMSTFCDLVSRIPTAVVVVSCLDDFYQVLKAHLARPIVDRLEKDPPPIKLKGPRERTEVVALLAHRLRSLYESQGAPYLDDDPTYPFPTAFIDKLVGMSTREVLSRCHEYRERCVAAGRLVPIDEAPVAGGLTPAPRIDATRLEQEWNATSRPRSRAGSPPVRTTWSAILARAVAACSDEDQSGRWFEVETAGRFVSVEAHAPDNVVDLLVVGVCNFSAKGGHLARQIDEVAERAGEHTPVIVRSTEFPSNPKTAVTQLLGKLIARGGRRAVVEDSDWRAMLAFPLFQAAHQAEPSFAAWLKEAKPLSRLRSLRTILDLDRQAPARLDDGEPIVETPVSPRPAASVPPAAASSDEWSIVIGTTNDRAREPVAIAASELTRHAAFLGGTGSGKTTLALSAPPRPPLRARRPRVVKKQLLMRGVPALLVDRKGDLVGYARPEAWSRPLGDADREARRARLRARVEVALYTPGNPHGRPLSIAVAPSGLGRLGQFERAQVARYAASALAGMMNYGEKGSDLSRQAILRSAIDLLAQLEPEGAVTLEALIEYVAERDPGLINALGRLDTKLFKKLVDDLETLRLSRSELLDARGEPLDAEALLGLGRHATTGKTRLTIVSTKFLGATQDVQFWVTQLLVELARWASRSPSPHLQAALLFDEADLYLPAIRQPPTKEPMEDLLRRARSAGIGLLLATQSPGDFDYKGRDNIRAWFVGQVKEATAIAKMKPMLSECRIDVESKLPAQEPGQFHLLRDGTATGLQADRSLIPTEQVPEDEILALARRTLNRARLGGSAERYPPHRSLRIGGSRSADPPYMRHIGDPDSKSIRENGLWKMPER